MKINLLFSVLLTVTFSFAQGEREIINQIDSINILALNYYQKNDLVNSYSEFNKAIKISDSLTDDYGNAVANFALGKIYMHMHNYQSAEASFLKMQKFSRKIEDNYLMASSYLNLGELYIKYDESRDVVPFFEEASKYALCNDVMDLNDRNDRHRILFQINMNLGKIYLDRNILNDATISLLKAKNNLANLPSNKYDTSNFNYYYGLYYVKMELYHLAIDNFTIAINSLKSNPENQDNNLLLSKIYKDLSVSLEKTGERDMAYAMLLERDIALAKYDNEEVIKQENINNSKYQIGIYKQEAKWANDGRILQENITNKTKNFNIYITIATILLSISFITLLINYISKRKLSKMLKVQNEELEIAKDLAEESSRQKSKFISNVSHELRTPLYGVVGLTSLMLKNNDLSGRDTKYLKSLKYSGDYLLNLINDILQVGKIESNKVELNNVSVKIKNLIENVVDSFEYGLEESNNQIHIAIDKRIPEFVECDKLRLTQVLFNLIGNSIKFTENGQIFLKVMLLNINENSADIRFEVEDTGMGIPKEKQSLIFENFSQLNEKININYQGTGLGLSITKKLVELFNSKMELQSELGKGSIFSFNVNFKIDHKAIEEIKQKRKNNIFSASRPKNMKILIAEDNKINQIVTSNLLKKEHYQFDIVENGVEAVEAFKKNQYELVLMDINMPLMDGNEATAEIRKLNIQIPIIALTASNLDELMESKSNIGFDAIITKPFDNEVFYSTISKLIEKYKTQKGGGKILELVS